MGKLKKKKKTREDNRVKTRVLKREEEGDKPERLGLHGSVFGSGNKFKKGSKVRWGTNISSSTVLVRPTLFVVK